MRKGLASSIVLGLMVTTLGYGGMAEGAVISSGTHDVHGTTSVNDGYVVAASDVVLNATEDTIISTISAGHNIFQPNANGVSIVVNGNGHDLTFNTEANNVAVDNQGDNASFSIIGAKNVNMNGSESGSNWWINSTNGTYTLQASNNVNFVNNCVNSANIILKKTNIVNITAGNDFNFYGQYNMLYLISNDSEITVTAGHDIIGEGISKAYPLVWGNQGKINILATNDVDLTSEVRVVHNRGCAMLIEAGKNVTLTAKANYSTINTSGKKAETRIIADKGSVNVLSTGGDNSSISLYSDSSLSLQAAEDINIGGNTAIALMASGGSNFNATSTTGMIRLNAERADKLGTGINISGENTDVNFNSDTTITAVKKGVDATGGKVTFDKALTATAAPIAVEASGGAKVSAMNPFSAKQVAGTMTADGAGTSVDMNFLTGDSYYIGATTVSNDGAINLSFANGAPWNVTADSSLTSLENNSAVNMTYSGKGNYETVTTDTMSGTGSFTMNTDLQASKDNLDVTTNSDKLVINSTSSGIYTINIDDTSLLSGKKAEGYLLLVEDKTSGGATFVGGDVAKGGLYKYTPLIISVNPGDNPDILDTYNNVPTGNVKNWYLAGYEKSGELQPVVAPLIGAGENRYAAYRFEQDNLLLRLGELRDNENSQGIWARINTAKEEVNNITDSRFTMYQVGYDKKYKDDENGRKYFGVAFNHTKGNQDYSSTSNGESSSNAMTLYNTWLSKKGHYLDLVGKVGKINTDWDYSNARFPDSGDSSAWFYSLSGEYGRKIMNKDGFYTEPQAQLTYGHINGAGYTSASGINAEQDSINSLIGRVGFTIGKHFNGEVDGKRTNVYAKLFYNYEFLGDSDVRMNDTYGDSYSHSGDFGGSWWTAGVGVTAQLDKKTNAYFDVQKTFGGDIDQKWQFNVGLRWTWGGAKKAKVVETVAPVETPAPVAAAPMADYYMDSVHFDTDQDVIRPDQAGKVTHFAEVAKENPNHTFKLVGNTDSDASDSYNEDLSRRRVERVKNAAEQKGVPAAQMQTNYKGEKDPASSNATAQGKADNRRVDMWEHK